jgi:spore photoproduct lyase
MIQKVNRKSFKIRYSGRSSDYISPSFGFGCLLNCAYCYMKRHSPKGLSVAKNVNEILTSVNNHAYFNTVEKPNQTDPEYVTYDISCNEDFALHRKYYDWQHIFDFFKTHPIAKATFATKIVPYDFLEYNPEGKVRIRFSVMPQHLSTILEPNTPSIIERLEAVDKFKEAGYEVHLNYSPVIYTDTWEDDYEELFKLVDKTITNKDNVKSEVIFLTHNANKHKNNLLNKVPGEEILWHPEAQEVKTSEYGGENIRYKAHIKRHFIDSFEYLHGRFIPWNEIRYIF